MYIDILKPTIEITNEPPSAMGTRSIAWKVKLRYLPQNQSAWPEALTTHRQSYMRLAAEFGIESHLYDGDCRRLDADLFRCIELDTERTFSRGNFFFSEAVKKMMKSILFIFAKVNPGIGYVSGMNEVLAVLLHVFGGPETDPLWLPHVEPDTFYCFSLLISEIRVRT